MSEFKVEVEWKMAGYFNVEADSYEEAKLKVEEDDVEYGIGYVEEEEMIDGSFKVVDDSVKLEKYFIMDYPSEVELTDEFLSKLKDLSIEYVHTPMYHKFYYIGNMVITPPIANNIDATIIANCVKLITGLYSLSKNAW